MDDPVGEPGVDRTRCRARHRAPDEQHICGRVEPRESEERRQQIPHRDVDRSRSAQTEHHKGPRRDQSVGDQQDRRDSSRHLEQSQRGTSTPENGQHADQQGQVPKNRTADEQSVVTQLNPTQTSRQPNSETDSSLRSPSVNERVHRRGLDPSVAEKGEAIKEAGQNQLERGQRREQRSDHQPHRSQAHEEQDGATSGAVDQSLTAVSQRSGIHRGMDVGRSGGHEGSFVGAGSGELAGSAPGGVGSASAAGSSGD